MGLFERSQIETVVDRVSSPLQVKYQWNLSLKIKFHIWYISRCLSRYWCWRNSFLVKGIIDKFCKNNSSVAPLHYLGGFRYSWIERYFNDCYSVCFSCTDTYVMKKSNNIHKICTDSYSTMPRIHRSPISLGFKNEVQVTSHKNTVVQKSSRINLKADT